MKPTMHRFISVIQFVIAAVLAWQLSVLVWKLNAPADSLAFNADEMNLWTEKAARPFIPDPRWEEKRLFPVKSVAPEPAPEPEAVPKTRINLVLKAVFVDSAAKRSGAIIARLNGPVQYYRPGEQIQPGVKLKEVHAEYVVIESRGRDEFLPFRDTPATSVMSPSSEPERPRANDFRSAIKRSVGLRSDSAQQVVRGLPTESSLARDIQSLTPKAFMKKYQKKLEKDPDQVLNEVGVMPSAGGGYVIGTSPYTPLLKEAGLREGDVIMSVNGQRLGNPTTDARLVGSLATQREVEVEVRRGARQFIVSVPIGR